MADQRKRVLDAGESNAYPGDTLVLLLDHQAGLLQTAKDISLAELRGNTAAVAKLAALVKAPVLPPASVPDGPNGPLMPELHQLAPHAIFLPRTGAINTWDDERFVKTVCGGGPAAGGVGSR